MTREVRVVSTLATVQPSKYHSTTVDTGVIAQPYNPTFQSHFFHMVENSPWPLLISLSLMAIAISAVIW